MPKEITKAKILNEAVSILWQEPNGRHTQRGEFLDCSDTPEKVFTEAMKQVEADLMKRAKGNVAFEAGGFTLTGISMTRNNAGRRQFSPSAKVNLGWGETGVSLPLLLAPDSEKPSGADNVLTKAELEHIEELFGEALRYLEGGRHQGTLDLTKKKDEKEAAAAAAGSNGSAKSPAKKTTRTVPATEAPALA